MASDGALALDAGGINKFQIDAYKKTKAEGGVRTQRAVRAN